jgi:hypothetical protein
VIVAATPRPRERRPSDARRAVEKITILRVEAAKRAREAVAGINRVPVDVRQEERLDGLRDVREERERLGAPQYV